MHATSITATVFLVLATAGMASPAHASLITIDGFQFDLDQFSDAYVTVSGVTDGNVHGSHFDNNFGIDPDESDEPNGNELGELAGREGGTWAGSDHGDRITLDGTDGPKSLTLHYGNKPVAIDNDFKFIVYEQSNHPADDNFIEEVDDEGKNFQIRFTFENNDSTGWFEADPGTYNENPPVTLSRVFDPDNPGSTQNQIVFSLFALDLGDVRHVTSIEISNLLDAPDGVNDPDFLFAGFATQASASTSVPLPSSMILLLSGLVFGGLFGAWRCGSWPMPAR